MVVCEEDDLTHGHAWPRPGPARLRPRDRDIHHDARRRDARLEIRCTRAGGPVVLS